MTDDAFIKWALSRFGGSTKEKALNVEAPAEPKPKVTQGSTSSTSKAGALCNSRNFAEPDATVPQEALEISVSYVVEPQNREIGGKKFTAADFNITVTRPGSIPAGGWFRYWMRVGQQRFAPPQWTQAQHLEAGQWVDELLGEGAA